MRCTFTDCKREADRPGKKICSVCAGHVKKYHERLRRDAFNAYGGPQCNCCGTFVNEFLTLDHIDGGGNKHREQLRSDKWKNHSGGGGIKLYLWLKRNHYPQGFQVLCMNCNFAKGKYGSCPHQRSQAAVA